MKCGKIQESILDRSVLKVLHRPMDSRGLYKPAVGLGGQILDVTDQTLLAVTVNTIEGTPEQAGVLTVPRAVNSLAGVGASPLGLMLSVTIPACLKEPEFRRMMRMVDTACTREGIEIFGGHTQISESVRRVIVSVTAIGETAGVSGGKGSRSTGDSAGGSSTGGSVCRDAGSSTCGNIGANGGEVSFISRSTCASTDGNEACEVSFISRSTCGSTDGNEACGVSFISRSTCASIDGGMAGGHGAGTGRREAIGRVKPGQDIVMTKWAGLSGSWLLEQSVHEAFSQRYHSDLAKAIQGMEAYFSVRKEAQIAMAYGAGALYDLSESGVFGGLWEMAEAGHAGLRIYLKKIPIRQETVELCDFVDVNPYLIPAMGALLISADHGLQMADRLLEEGIPAAVIGCVTEGADRVVINGDEVRYLEPYRGSVIEAFAENANL